jgi:transglutaminase-like putative cysteine protease
MVARAPVYTQQRPPPAPAPAARKSGTVKNSRPAFIAVFTVFIVVAAAFTVGMLVPDPGENDNKVVIQTASADTYFELSGDFLPERDIFTVSLTDDGSIAFALNDDVSSKYVHYSWTFFDHDHTWSNPSPPYSKYTGETKEKTEPVLYYLSQKIGEYRISVKCYTESGEKYVHSATYSGNVGFKGIIIKEYKWTYQGKQYTVSTSFSYDEYSFYKDKNPNGRWPRETEYHKVVSFVTYKEPAVATLAASLKEAYGSHRSTADQSFATFVLGFVQVCFKYPPHTSSVEADKYLYGQNDYFAFPLETLFYGMGDCEDTAILAAALFKALGYGAGVVIIPGHAVAAVGLNDYTPGYYSPFSYEILSKPIGGVTYYACETTSGTFQGIGLISAAGSGGKKYNEYIGVNGYNFYIV